MRKKGGAIAEDGEVISGTGTEKNESDDGPENLVGTKNDSSDGSKCFMLCFW